MKMIIGLNSEIKQTVNSNKSMWNYLVSLNKHVDFTPRSWEYDGEHGNAFLTTDEIKDKWVRILASKLDSDSGAQNHDENQDLRSDAARNLKIFQFDTSQLEKWGPQGGHAPINELLKEVVLPSFLKASEPKPTAFDNPLWRQAKDRVLFYLKEANLLHGIRPAAYESVVEDMRVRDTLESNSGYPDFARRSLGSVKARAISDAKTGKWKDYPAIALFRTYNGKTRLVWMFPMATNLVEGAFFQPMMNAIVNYSLAHKNSEIAKFFSPWRGFEDVREVMTQAFEEGEPIIAASDFSSTDAHFQKWATLEVWDVLKEMLTNDSDRALFKESLMHMHEIPLLIGPDSMITGDHGVSSGSNWTNFIETVFDWIFAEYFFLTAPGSDARKAITGVMPLYAIGDDMSWRIYGPWGKRGAAAPPQAGNFFKTALEVAGLTVGQEIKAEKTSANYYWVKSLQRLFIRDYIREDGRLRAIYPTVRALKSIVFPERFHNPKHFDKDMFCLRTFMILENCVDHPLFKEFVEFVCKGNKHLIPFAKNPDSYLRETQRRSKFVPGLNATYNQEKRDSSITDFASIRIAREL